MEMTLVVLGILSDMDFHGSLSVKKADNMKETEKSFIAGFIEGEGNISLIKSKNKSSLNGVALSPTVCITNTNIEMLKYILDICKIGHLHTFLRKRKQEHKNKSILQLRKKSDVLSFLIEIEPYLVAKRSRALLLMEFCRNGEKRTNKWSHYSNRDFEIWEEMKILNKTGTDIGTKSR